jgi:ribosomal protein L24
MASGNPRAARLVRKAAAVKAKRLPCPYRGGDTVYIYSGADRETTGPFMKYDSKKNLVYVEGRHQIEKYVKASPERAREGGRVKVELPYHVSSTAWYCLSCMKPSSLRRRVEVTEEGDRKIKKVTWVCRRCGAERPAAKRK